MRCCQIVIIVFVLSLLVGCSSSYLVDTPHVLLPSHQKESKKMATAAFLMALEGKRWTIEGANIDAGQVRAKACRGRYCLSIEAKVDDNGNIAILRAPDQYISLKGGRLLQYWMRHLTQAYEKYRSKSPKTLRSKLENSHYPPFVRSTALALPKGPVHRL